MHQSIDWYGVLLSLTDSLWHTCKNRWMTPWVHWPKSQGHRKLSMRSLFSDGCMPSSYLDPLHPVLKYSQGSIKVTRFLLVARWPHGYPRYWPKGQEHHKLSMRSSRSMLSENWSGAKLLEDVVRLFLELDDCSDLGVNNSILQTTFFASNQRKKYSFIIKLFLVQ